MKCFLVLLLGLMSAAYTWAGTDSITCEKKGKGYLPYNHTTGVWLGSGYLIKKNDCQNLLYTEATVDGVNVMCSWLGKGYTVYKARTGEILSGRDNVFWFDLSTCQHAIVAQNNGLICAPRNTGSGVYDVTNGYFIGDGYYYDIENCAIATSYSKLDTTCTVAQGGHNGIYLRRFNVPWSSELFLTALQCGKANLQ